MCKQWTLSLLYLSTPIQQYESDWWKKMTGEGKKKNHSNLLAIPSNVTSDFRCPLQDTANGLGLQKAGDEKLQKPGSFPGISEKWDRNVSKIIHITHTTAKALLIALGGLKQQPVKNKRPSGSLWFPDTLKKKVMLIYNPDMPSVTWGFKKRHCKDPNKSYCILL